MKNTEPRRVRDAIDSVVEQLGLGTRLKQYDVLAIWPEIVGEHIAGIARAERIDRGVLTVRVSRATWRNELLFLKSDLLAKINKHMNGEIVHDIIFR